MLEHSSTTLVKIFNRKNMFMLPSICIRRFLHSILWLTLQFDSFSKGFVLVDFFVYFVRNLKVFSGPLSNSFPDFSLFFSIFHTHSPFSLTFTPMAVLTAFSETIKIYFSLSYLFHRTHLKMWKHFSQSNQDSLLPALKWSPWNAWKSNSN